MNNNNNNNPINDGTGPNIRVPTTTQHTVLHAYHIRTASGNPTQSIMYFFSPGATTPIGGCILQPSSGL